MSTGPHPHLTAPTQLGEQANGNVDHGESARLVLPPAADTPAKQHHDSSHRAEGRHQTAASAWPDALPRSTVITRTERAVQPGAAGGAGSNRGCAAPNGEPERGSSSGSPPRTGWR